jgi:hypothetical protein
MSDSNKYQNDRKFKLNLPKYGISCVFEHSTINSIKVGPKSYCYKKIQGVEKSLRQYWDVCIGFDACNQNKGCFFDIDVTNMSNPVDEMNKLIEEIGKQMSVPVKSTPADRYMPKGQWYELHLKEFGFYLVMLGSGILSVALEHLPIRQLQNKGAFVDEYRRSQMQIMWNHTNGETYSGEFIINDKRAITDEEFLSITTQLFDEFKSMNKTQNGNMYN